MLTMLLLVSDPLSAGMKDLSLQWQGRPVAWAPDWLGDRLEPTAMMQ